MVPVALAVPVVPVAHQKDSAALTAPGPVALDHPPKASNEDQDERPETVLDWIAPGEVKAKADLIKAKPTMVLPSGAEEVVEVAEVAGEAVAEAAIPGPRHRLHCRTKRTPDH